MTFREKYIQTVLEVARKEVGVRESPSNWGPRVQEYLAAVNITFPAPWCAAYNRWCMVEAAKQLNQELSGVPILTQLSARLFASCDYIGLYARKAGILYQKPKIGDLFLVRQSASDWTHTGIVHSVFADGSFGCYEGNTNDNGSREGIGVFKRTRSIKTGNYDFVRFADEMAGGLWTPSVGSQYVLLSGTARIPLPLIGGRSLMAVRQWAKLMGFNLTFDDVSQTFAFNGRPVPLELTLIDNLNHAPLRQLAQAAGLLLDVDNQARTVRLIRPSA